MPKPYQFTLKLIKMSCNCAQNKQLSFDDEFFTNCFDGENKCGGQAEERQPEIEEEEVETCEMKEESSESSESEEEEKPQECDQWSGCFQDAPIQQET